MKRLQKKRLEFKGEITAFLSLIFLLVISLVGVMMQSASIHITKSMKRSDMELAMESIFAEYQPELLKRYEVFAREGTSPIAIAQRLDFYGANNMNHTIEKIEFLSDQNGAVFYEQVVRFMGGEPVREEALEFEQVEKEAQDAWGNLDSLLQEEENGLASEDNPIDVVKKLQGLNLLTLVLEDTETISNRKVVEHELASHRELQKGRGYEKSFPNHNVLHKYLFTTYLNKHFYNYQNFSEEHPILYEAEYLLGGKPSDEENLKVVASKLLMLRMGINYSYLFASGERQAEAQAMALGLSSLLVAPEAAELVKQALLFAWAYGESVLDLRSLFRGQKIPAYKTDANWTLQLAKVPELLKNEKTEVGFSDKEGVAYQEYLRTLFLMEQEEILSMRALDLIELNLRIKADECVTGLQIGSAYEMQQGITDSFSTEYVYQ